jgi:amino acid adenylation domain-containing protein
MSEQQAMASATEDFDPFAGPAIARVVPTTEAQRELWLAAQLGAEASLAYNESITLELHGVLDFAALRGALADLAARHESLRATVSGDGLQMLVAESGDLTLAVEDLSALPAESQQAAVERQLALAVETPFDLESGPLARAILLRLSEIDHRLLLTVHHLVCDGWSFGVLCRDLGRLYAARRAGTALDTPADRMGDYALAEAADTASAEFAAAERYWLAQFDGSVPVLELPTDRLRVSPRRFESRREDALVPSETLARLRRAAGVHGASLFGVLLAGFAGTLARIANCSDLVVGVPSAGQSLRDMPNLVGHCVNLLPLRLRPEAARPAAEFIGQTQTAVLDGFDNARYTFGTLLKKLRLPRDPGRPALVSVMFNLDQPIDGNSLGLTGLDVSVRGNPRHFESFELFLNVAQEGDALRLECQYASSLFDAASVRVWLRSYVTLLEDMAARPDQPLGQLALVAAEDLARMREWNATACAFDRRASLVAHLAVDAPHKAARTAIVCDDARLSYAVLDRRSTQLAHALRKRGAGRGALVGLHLARGADLMIGLLAVLKTGAGYVPLDPGFPVERLRMMAEDADLRLLLTADALPPGWTWPADRLFRLDSETPGIEGQPITPVSAEAQADPGDPAYVIYTSGSTGKPKGVFVPQSAVVNFLASMAREPGLQPGARLLAVTTLSFDIAVLELLLPLAVGATVLLATREQAMDGFALDELLRTHGATVMQATPSTWRLLIEAGWRGSGDFTALVGGEALPRDLAEQLLERTGALWNMYGPTETTVWSTCEQVRAPLERISIGRPIANTTVWILDEGQQPCPPGVPGEICIGGDGVTLGYHRRPELTAEKFIADYWSGTTSARLYRTGDRGRWLHDGRLDHQGRFDFQVKIRGYRIELGEVEAQLARFPDVAQVVAMAREDRPGDVRLVAYVVAQGAPLEPGSLREHLRKTLPDYMIPQHFVSLDTLPLLPNGKINRKALPPPASAELPRTTVLRQISDVTLAQVVDAFEAVLNLPGVAADDDFFALGGHSLMAAQLAMRLTRLWGRQVALRAIFAHPTPVGLAQWREQHGADRDAPPPRILHDPTRQAAPLSLMQQRLWFLEQLQPGRSTYNVPSGHRLTGHLDEAAFSAALDALIRRQPALRTVIGLGDDEPVQIILPPFALPVFPAEDLSALAPAEREARLAVRLRQLALEVFDLEQGPLVSAHLFRLAADEHVFFFMAHHLVWDGWSFDILYRELGALYANALDPGNPTPPELEVTYADFAAWQREFMRGETLQVQVEHWRKALTGADTELRLPTDQPRPPRQSGRGASAWINLDRELTDAVHAHARRAETTPFVVLLAAFVATLNGLTGQRDIVVGTPVRGRSLPELESVMGFFVNALPIRIRPETSASLFDLLRTTRAAVLDAFGQPDVPFEHLVRALALPRDESRFPLYQSFFSYQDGRDRPRAWGPLQHRPNFVERAVANEDLGLWFLEREDGLRGGLIVNADILTVDSAARIGRLYTAMLRQLLQDASVALDAAVTQAATAVALPAAWIEQRAHAAAQKNAPPAPTAQAPSRQSKAPSTEAEKTLAGIWTELLGVPDISTTDNFFDLGGHSLLAMKAIVEMDKRLGKRVNPRRYIFETLAQIVAAPDERPSPPRSMLGRVLSAFKRKGESQTSADHEGRG